MQALQSTDIETTLPLWQADQQALILTERIEQTADSTSFIFNSETPAQFHYKAGQFTLLEVEIDGVLHHRAYTISSSPSRPDNLEITIKRVEDGLVSNHLIDHLKVGDKLNASSASGEFNLQDGSDAEHYVFISAGSGITPLMSMSRYLLDNNSKAQIHFIHSARHDQDIIFYDELQAMAAQHSNFRLDLLLTRQASSHFQQGRLDRNKLQQLVPELSHRAVFTCGSNGFMEMLESLLQERGFDLSRFHKESFDGEDLIPAEVGAADLAYELSVPSFGKTTTINGDERLMDVLLKEQLPLIVACQSGICGSCKCRVVSGEVEASSQSPLTPEEIAQGYVLACSSRAKSDLEIALS
jgi:NADH oxidoreductase Hcr